MKSFILLLASIVQGESVASNSFVHLYLGDGCYWARQHLFIAGFEKGVLKRKDSELTAVTGYAGSAKFGAGGKVCYHNSEGKADYEALGHAEVVSLEVPASSLVELFSTYFKSFVESSPGVWSREDFADFGPAYRSVVGFPGGMANDTMLAAMNKANLHNMTLTAGAGADPDNYHNNTVYVMDSDKFPFVQAELCMQFHDGIGAAYPEAYHNLSQTLQHEGRLHSTGCPIPDICGIGAGNAKLLAKADGVKTYPTITV